MPYGVPSLSLAQLRTHKIRHNYIDTVRGLQQQRQPSRLRLLLSLKTTYAYINTTQQDTDHITIAYVVLSLSL